MSLEDFACSASAQPCLTTLVPFTSTACDAACWLIFPNGFRRAHHYRRNRLYGGVFACRDPDALAALCAGRARPRLESGQGDRGAGSRRDRPRDAYEPVWARDRLGGVSVR